MYNKFYSIWQVIFEQIASCIWIWWEENTQQMAGLSHLSAHSHTYKLQLCWIWWNTDGECSALIQTSVCSSQSDYACVCIWVCMHVNIHS